MIANPWILKNKNKNKKPNIRDYKLSKQIKKPQIPKIFTFLFLILALFFSLNSCSPPLSFFLSTPTVRASPRPSFLWSHLFFFFSFAVALGFWFCRTEEWLNEFWLLTFEVLGFLPFSRLFFRFVKDLGHVWYTVMIITCE